MAVVLLFNPPDPENRGFTREGRCTQEAGIWGTQWPPVSLATAAAMLERDGHTVKVVDFPARGGTARQAGSTGSAAHATAAPPSLERTLEELQPDFAFWTTGTPTIESDLGIAHLVRRCSPKTVAGVLGTHVSVQPEAALGAAPIDLVIRREPEAIIREVCRRHGSLRTVQGISWRDPDTGAIHHNPDAPFLDPDEIPPPAWHLLDTSSYRLPLRGRPFLIVAPVRGCPYACSFCTGPVYYGRRLRKRPVRKVVDEIEGNISRFGITEFFIWADTFTADRDYVLDFCREILDRGLRISWTCNSRVDTVDRGMLAAMKRAGLWMISFGLESGSDAVLRACGKRITVARSAEAVRMAHRAGIETAGHFILGLPGETEDTMRETLRLALDLPLDVVQFYAAAPFPGTPLYEEALRNGWLDGDRAFSQNRAALHLPGLPPRQVDQFRRYAYKRFYLRPRTIRQLLSLCETGSIEGVLRTTIRFLDSLRVLRAFAVPWIGFEPQRREGREGDRQHM